MYILDKNKEPIRCENIQQWGEWISKKENKRVALTKKLGITISTVFLGVDHNFVGGPPIIFETMIFGGDHDQEMMRYTSWEDAVSGHCQVCERLGISVCIDGSIETKLIEHKGKEDG